MLRLNVSIALVAAVLLALPACSDDSGNPKPDAPIIEKDSGPKDSGPDTGKKWECNNPGGACNAHDTCAINPVCGQDGFCYPEGFQNCDDELACTEDTCKALGVCTNTPKAGTCALRVKEAGKTVIKCFNKGDTAPDDQCAECDPETDPLNWSPKNGGQCDDGNPCTSDDYCQNGTCKGTDYASKCDDKISCTTDCDGLGGCLTTKPIKATSCLIGGKCYTEGAKNPANCSTCDPSKSQTAWTSAPSTCLINNACYNPGDKHPGGCAECDPAVNATAWTVKVTDKCLIDNVCRNPSDQDAIKCGECKPATDKYTWTPIAGKCKIAGACYAVGEKNTGACAECDPAINATAWTVKGNNCLIGNVCKNPLDTDTTGCQECAPATNKYAWSAVAGKCKIGSSCYSDAQTDTSGCLVCSYAATPIYWSPNPAVQKSVFNFDAGTTLPSGWTENHTDTANNVLWQIHNKRAVSGSYALYYGNKTASNYDTGAVPNGGNAILSGLPIAAGKNARLVFKVWLGLESTSSSVETFEIRVGSGTGPVVWTRTKVGAGFYNTTWVEQIVDLTPYAGTTIDLYFSFFTGDALKNTTEGIYLDDVMVLHDC